MLVCRKLASNVRESCELRASLASLREQSRAQLHSIHCCLESSCRCCTTDSETVYAPGGICPVPDADTAEDLDDDVTITGLLLPFELEYIAVEDQFNNSVDRCGVVAKRRGGWLE